MNRQFLKFFAPSLVRRFRQCESERPRIASANPGADHRAALSVAGSALFRATPRERLQVTAW
jgi:hypothetical protein